MNDTSGRPGATEGLRAELDASAARLEASLDEARAASERSLERLRQIEDGLKAKVEKVELDYSGWRVNKTARELVDAEKPLFDFVRYVLQTVAVGVAGLTVTAFLYSRDVDLVSGLFSWASVILCAVVFMVMVVRVVVLGMELVDRLLPERKWLASASYLRTFLATTALICLLFFILQLFAATLLQVIKSLPS